MKNFFRIFWLLSSLVLLQCSSTSSTFSSDKPLVKLKTLAFGTENISGHTFNPFTGTYFFIRNKDRHLYEADSYFELLRDIEIKIPDSSIDLEDIVYLRRSPNGKDEYALVNEVGEVFIGEIPNDETTVLDMKSPAFQKVTYAGKPPVENKGGEGIAYDPSQSTLYVCMEKSPMKIYKFQRPASPENISYKKGLAVAEPFDAEKVLGPQITDISSCVLDARTGRLLILSEESQKIVDVSLDGKINGVLSIKGPKLQYEGISFSNRNQIILSAEPNSIAIIEP